MSRWGRGQVRPGPDWSQMTGLGTLLVCGRCWSFGGFLQKLQPGSPVRHKSPASKPGYCPSSGHTSGDSWAGSSNVRIRNAGPPHCPHQMGPRPHRPRRRPAARLSCAGGRSRQPGRKGGQAPTPPCNPSKPRAGGGLSRLGPLPHPGLVEGGGDQRSLKSPNANRPQPDQGAAG
jgi:hypothetical protein